MDTDRITLPPVALIARSHLRLTGQPLLDGLQAGSSDTTIEAAMHATATVIVAHGTEPDPVFFYGNPAALRLFEANQPVFTAMPSRLSAEPMLRAEREHLLARVRSHGYIDDYSGVRVSTTGRRFRIERATVWNLVDEDGTIKGQAAKFSQWVGLPFSPAWPPTA
jgi:hypothetical protein